MLLQSGFEPGSLVFQAGVKHKFIYSIINFKIIIVQDKARKYIHVL